MNQKPTSILSCYFVILSLALSQSLPAASATWGSNSNSAWYTNSNWASGAYPGLQGAAASNTDVATFTNAYTGTTVGINMNTASLNLGAISIDSSRTTALNIGNSSGITSGVLRLYGSTVNSVSNVVVRHNGTGLLTFQATQSGTMGIVLSNAATNNTIVIDNTGSIAISSIISGSNTSQKLILQGTGSGTLTLSGANTYAGGTLINAGTLLLSGGGALANTGAVELAGATSVFNLAAITATSETTGRLIGVSSSSVVLGGKTLILDDALDATFSGNLSGTNGSLTKQGSGVQTLAGNNTFTGTLSVLGGTLLLGSATALPSTATLSLSGGTLKTDGLDASTGVLKVGANGGTIDFTDTTSSVSFASSQAESWSGLLKVFNWNGLIHSPSAGTEALLFPNSSSLNTTQLAQVQFYSDNGITPVGTGAGFYNGTGELVPVPEPGAMLNSLALLGLIGFRERKWLLRQRAPAAFATLQ
jgi:fibronectin-binding autotransporter adhesin